MQTLKVAISPCPNDIFIFGPWILGFIPDLPGIQTRFSFLDIEELNQAALTQKFELIKVSASIGLKLESSHWILNCGGAFGLGQGPKLVCLPDQVPEQVQTIAVPGLATTAFCLLQKAWPKPFQPISMLFSDIPRAIVKGKVDAGLLIHETALAYQEHGLKLVLDLGQWWLKTTSNLPLPLGVILLDKSCELEKNKLEKQIRKSLNYAQKNLGQIKPLLKVFAQEMDEAILEKHVNAYVNEFSLDLGLQGKTALLKLKNML